MAIKKPKKLKTISLKKIKSNLPKTVQQTIPFKDMRRDGICMVDDDYYTKTIQFADINYELADEEEQENIFKKYCDFLNTFESDVDIQFTYQNKKIDSVKFKKDIALPKRKFDTPELQELYEEYQQMLFDQFDRCNSDTTKVKFLTFGVHEENFKKAQSILNRVESDITRKFKKMYVRVTPLNGYDRLKLLKESLHPTEIVPFNFDWKTRQYMGISVKDSIAPTSMDFTKLDTFRIGRTIGRSYFILIDNAEISDRIVEELMSTNGNVSINIHTSSENKSAALKFAGNKLTTINGVKVGVQRKAAQSGYDGDILSPNLVSEIDSCESIYNAISRRNQRIFKTTILVTIYGKNTNEIAAIEKDVKSITQKYNCELKVLDDLQEEAAMSSLPLGVNKVPIHRPFITTELATFMPFTSQDVFTPNATYYGFNPLSNRMITLDRKSLKNLGGLILGQAGTGKSFTAKREILDNFFRTNDRIIICDPEAEYCELTKQLGGTVIDISATSQHHLNPFDINLKSDEHEDDPVSVKSQFILSICEAAIGGKYGLNAAEKSIIDRCIKKIYEKYLANPIPENIPIFEDLYNELRNQQNNENAQSIADSIEIFVKGSLSIFNNRTNVDIDSRIICFNIKKLSKHLHKMGILAIIDHVWNRVSQGRDEKRYTYFYIDEFHLILRDELTAEYSVDMWKRFRKWLALPTGITQNVTDILLSPQIENILKNSAFITLLGQAAGDRELVAERLNISPQEMEYITDTGVGEGLIYYNDKYLSGSITPFKDTFPTNTKAYKIMTTSYDG